MSSRCFSKISATSVKPPWAAMCIGARPSFVVPSTVAPCCRRNATILENKRKEINNGYKTTHTVQKLTELHCFLLQGVEGFCRLHFWNSPRLFNHTIIILSQTLHVYLLPGYVFGYQSLVMSDLFSVECWQHDKILFLQQCEVECSV